MLSIIKKKKHSKLTAIQRWKINSEKITAVIENLTLESDSSIFDQQVKEN